MQYAVCRPESSPSLHLPTCSKVGRTSSFAEKNLIQIDSDKYIPWIIPQNMDKTKKGTQNVIQLFSFQLLNEAKRSIILVPRFTFLHSSIYVFAGFFWDFTFELFLNAETASMVRPALLQLCDAEKTHISHPQVCKISTEGSWQSSNCRNWNCPGSTFKVIIAIRQSINHRWIHKRHYSKLTTSESRLDVSGRVAGIPRSPNSQPICHEFGKSFAKLLDHPSGTSMSQTRQINKSWQILSFKNMFEKMHGSMHG